MEYTSDVETCIDMIKYEMFCVKEINLVKNEKWQINLFVSLFHSTAIPWPDFVKNNNINIY